jgi:hypothetical protein
MDGIVAARMKGVALAEAANRQPRAAPEPMCFQRPHRIFGARRPKATDGRGETRESLIKMDQSDEKLCHWLARR